MRKQEASNLFKSGNNCAQSVLISFRDILNMDENQLRGIAAGFGGGMGKLQLTCGAVTGAFMVFSMYSSMHTKDNASAKSMSTELIRSFNEKYKAKTGSLSCRDILGVDMNSEEGQRVASEKNLFGTVCVDAVETAVEIAEEILKSVGSGQSPVGSRNR